jgi:heme-degrading monooxygenase HmoA
MFARVTTTQAAPDRADEAVRVITEQVIPGVEGIAGFKGGLWLLDRAAGKGLSVTLFETEEALRASEAAAARIRQEAVGQIQAGVVSVERYEVVASAGIAETVARHT